MAVRDVVQAAAGVGGGDKLYVEDVFSTYLYTGNGSTQSIENGIALGDFGVGTCTEFDGTNDYLSRSSDLTGNSDNKTFTLSFWVYLDGVVNDQKRLYWLTDGSDYSFYCDADNGGGQFKLIGRNVTNTKILDMYSTSSESIKYYQWNHILVSIDLENTSNRYMYVNDVSHTVTWSTYTNDSIDFSRAIHNIAGTSGVSSTYLQGKLSNLFLDYTYRDLSVEANRRLFIDANGGSTAPSTLSALSPILYLPMTEDYSIGENLGTGGDFTANGSPTIVQSGTQYEAGYGKGGMVWGKRRNSTGNHFLVDTASGSNKVLISDSTTSQITSSVTVTGFNANGFGIGAGDAVDCNNTGGTYASWSLRKSPNFFDVVTYTGNGATNRQISHNLDSEVGFIIIKRTDGGATNWFTLHRSFSYDGGSGSNSTDGVLMLNSSDAANASFPETENFPSLPTSTNFTVGYDTNFNTATYVAYLFAHDAGGFGDDGEQNVISCGSFTTDGSGNATVDLGWEPQWILYKRSQSTGSWLIEDTMRGASVNTSSNVKYLLANTSGAEETTSFLYPTSTGFTGSANSIADTSFIYIAIRRPMKNPESGIEVFASLATPATTEGNVGFPADLAIAKYPIGSQFWLWGDRLRNAILYSDQTSAENAHFGGAGPLPFDTQNGVKLTSIGASDYDFWMFRRAPSVFDVVCYTGTGVDQTQGHNLGVEPELWISKVRNGTDDWSALAQFTSTGCKYGNLNLDGGFGDLLFSNAYSPFSARPSSTSFSLRSLASGWNNSGSTYVAYLFATLAGVSKVGSYTGTGADLNVDCGFSAGARFVLIKRSGTGDWYVWDSARGIVSGNDPYLLLNSTAAEEPNTDYIDPLSSGFTVTSNASSTVNVDTGTYIFLAIA